MRESREEQKLYKVFIQETMRNHEPNTLDSGDLLVANATASASVVLHGSDYDPGDFEGSPLPKRINHNFNYSRVLDCEMGLFSATLKETDADQIAIELELLSFEHDKYLRERRRYDQELHNRKE